MNLKQMTDQELLELNERFWAIKQHDPDSAYILEQIANLKAECIRRYQDNPQIYNTGHGYYLDLLSAKKSIEDQEASSSRCGHWVTYEEGIFIYLHDTSKGYESDYKRTWREKGVIVIQRNPIRFGIHPPLATGQTWFLFDPIDNYSIVKIINNHYWVLYDPDKCYESDRKPLDLNNLQKPRQ